MIKRLSIALAIILLMTGGLVYANRTPRGGDSFAAFYPKSFSVTTYMNPDSKVTLPLTLLDARQNSKRTDPSLFTAYIVAESIGSFQVEVTAVEEAAQMRHGEDTIYIYNFSIGVPETTNFAFKDAHLRLLYNDGSEEKLYIGDIAFIYIPESAPAPHLYKLRALPVINMETWEMTALIIEFEVKEELRLEAFDFGLPKYGIDSQRVTCLPSSMDKLEGLYSDHALDQQFDAIYTLPKTPTREISLGGVVMKPGLNTLVIPFTFIEDALTSPICALGGLLHYSIDGVPYSYPIETIPYIFGYPTSPIEEYLNNVRS